MELWRARLKRYRSKFDRIEAELQAAEDGRDRASFITRPFYTARIWAATREFDALSVKEDVVLKLIRKAKREEQIVAALKVTKANVAILGQAFKDFGNAVAKCYDSLGSRAARTQGRLDLERFGAGSEACELKPAAQASSCYDEVVDVAGDAGTEFAGGSTAVTLHSSNVNATVSPGAAAESGATA